MKNGQNFGQPQKPVRVRFGGLDIFDGDDEKFIPGANDLEAGQAGTHCCPRTRSPG